MARVSSDDVIVLGKRRRKRLERIVARAGSPQYLVLRARIVLAAWRREANAKIGRELRVTLLDHHVSRPGSAGRLSLAADQPAKDRQSDSETLLGIGGP